MAFYSFYEVISFAAQSGTMGIELEFTRSETRTKPVVTLAWSAVKH